MSEKHTEKYTLRSQPDKVDELFKTNELESLVEEKIRDFQAKNKVKEFKESDIEEIADSIATKRLIEDLPKFLPKYVDPKGITQDHAGKVILPTPRAISTTYKNTAVGALVRRNIKSKRPLMLSGPSGSGKGFVIEQELNKAKMGYYVLSCAEGLRLSDFTARQELGEGKTSWVLGTLPLSMKYGVPIILDEIDAIQQELAQILLRALEYRDLLIPQTGETVKAHPEWVCFATCNTLRDETGGYAGTRPSTALLNRFQFVACDYMKIQDEISIFKQIGADHNLADRVAHWLKSVRPLHMKRQVSMAPSTRVGINIVRECLGIDEHGTKVNEPLSFEESLMFCFVGSLPDREIHNLKSNSLW